jgi:hypothetical protein
VGHPAQDELVRRIIEAVDVLEDEPALAQELGVLQLGQRGVRLRHEQRVGLGARGNEGRIDGEVVVGRMAGPAGAPVATEGLVEEEERAATDQGIGRLDVIGDPPGDRIQRLRLTGAEEALLEERPRADGDARGSRILAAAGDHHQVEVEIDVGSDRHFQGAGRARAVEAPDLEELVASFWHDAPAVAGDVLDEPEIEGAAIGDVVEGGEDPLVDEVEGGLPRDRASRRPDLLGAEAGVKSVPDAEDRGARVGERLGEGREGVGQPVGGPRRRGHDCLGVPDRPRDRGRLGHPLDRVGIRLGGATDGTHRQGSRHHAGNGAWTTHSEEADQGMSHR